MFALSCALFFLFLGILFGKFVWSFKKNEFFEAEAKRCLKKICEADEDWNSNGRIYTKGLALIKKKNDENRKFIKQLKLHDIGILE